MGRIDYLVHKLNPIPQRGKGFPHETEPYWHGRFWSQMNFLWDVSKLNGNCFDAELERILETAYASFLEQGDVLTRETCLQAEQAVSDQARAMCKTYQVICIGHAHIDMNWMWAFDETVSVTLETFRTMLKLMEEYPQFTFGQSQASCYQIVEQYGEPEMLEEIRRHVKEGRWEITASTWVEADKNMPSLESMARHALYTKRYLSRLLNVDMDSMNFDFEPDTFGHSVNIPEIVSKAGVKFYYHNRGSDMETCFTRWEAPSGERILVYRDTSWYNAHIDARFLFGATKACRDSGQKTMLKIYGVGDHGGGPTRRDISSIIDRMDWPVYPVVKFGTYQEFYSIVDRDETCIPVVKGERNPVFTGCYTTQTRIKEAIRLGERVLGESEKFSAFDTLETGHPYPAAGFEEAWKKVLFSQFHDILTGSGVRGTREYALGTFQQTMAFANTERSRAMRNISSRIDTSAWMVEEDLSRDTADGAGVGYGSSDMFNRRAFTRSGRYGAETNSHAAGKNRVFTIFNSAPFTRTETVELVLWDWMPRDAALVRLTLPDGTVVPHQIVGGGFHGYWDHNYTTLVARVTVPACGYTTLLLGENQSDLDLPQVKPFNGTDYRHVPDAFVLENELVRVELDVHDGTVVSYVDKQSGRELIDQTHRGGVFRYILEDVDKGMSAWIDGRYKSVRELTDDVRIRKLPCGDLRQSVLLEIPIQGASKMQAVLSLDAGSKVLHYDCTVDWHEIGTQETWQQLNFSFPLPYQADSYLYQVPGGMLERAKANIDMPTIGYLAAVDQTPARGGWMMTTDSKYGVRGTDNRMNITLIRSSIDPDPLPESGTFRFHIALNPMECFSAVNLQQTDYAINNPLLSMVSNAHKGSLPTELSFLTVEAGSCVLQSAKMDEETGASLVLRLSEVAGADEECVVTLRHTPKTACFVNFCEQELPGEIRVEGNQIRFTAAPYTQHTVQVSF